jgi:hypothetical protein
LELAPERRERAVAARPGHARGAGGMLRTPPIPSARAHPSPRACLPERDEDGCHTGHFWDSAPWTAQTAQRRGRAPNVMRSAPSPQGWLAIPPGVAPPRALLAAPEFDGAAHSLRAYRGMFSPLRGNIPLYALYHPCLHSMDAQRLGSASLSESTRRGLQSRQGAWTWRHRPLP